MVAADATAIEVAAVMAGVHSPIVAVVDGSLCYRGDRGVAAIAGAPAGRRARRRVTAQACARGRRLSPPAYLLIATERVHRVAAALGGGPAWCSSAWSTRTPRSSPDTGIDWNVIFLLFGMMVIVGVLKQTGVFEYLAIWAAKRARGRPTA